jgi:hypothetical protein
VGSDWRYFSVTPISLGIFASANQSAGATSFESIATVTVGSGGSTNVEFASIPSTYSHLQVRGIARYTASSTSDGINAQFNNDSSSNAYYAYHILYGNGSSAAAVAGGSDVQILFADATGASALSNNFGTFVMDILDYKDTNKYKTTRSLYGWDNNGSGIVALASALWKNTSAINTIDIFSPGKTFAQYSTFALYGIKSA